MIAFIAIILSIITAVFVAMNKESKEKWHETIESRLAEVEQEIKDFNERYEAIKEEK